MDGQTVRVNLSPKPGFCIKSSALESAVCKISPSRPSANKSIEGSAALIPNTISIPEGTKVFVNIAWDANVPPPPEGSEDAIQKAMSGEGEFDEEALVSGRGWFVPVIVSEPRSDIDKGERLRCYSCSPLGRV